MSYHELKQYDTFGGSANPLLRNRGSTSLPEEFESQFVEHPSQISFEEIERRKLHWGRQYLDKYTATSAEILAYDAHRRTIRGKIISFCEQDESSELLQGSKWWRNWSLFYQFVNVAMVFLSTTSFIIGTEPIFYASPPAWTYTFDILTVAFFSSDYFIRFVCAYSQFRFAINLFNIFDLLSFVPTFIEWIIKAAAGIHAADWLGFFRLFRVFRLMRLIQFSPTLKIVLKSLRKSTEGFGLLILIIILDLVFFSTTMYFVEGASCHFDTEEGEWLYNWDNSTSPFQSITMTFWWNIVSITTVGYGDVVPRTGWGRVVAGFALVSGIVLLAFPIAIFGTNFGNLHTEWMEKKREEKEALLLHEHKADALIKDKELLVVQSKLLEMERRLIEESARNAEFQRQTALTLDKLFLSVIYAQKGEKEKGEKKTTKRGGQ